MVDLLDFILARYNYWVVIILMMTGLYIVFSRGNLVKKIIGLNIFQTSVFIFYITIGKISGGTAPIFIGGHNDGHENDHGTKSHGGDEPHGDTHNDNHGNAHSNEAALTVEDAPTLHDAAHANQLPDAHSANVEQGSDSLHVVSDDLSTNLANSILADPGGQATAGSESVTRLTQEADAGIHDIAASLVEETSPQAVPHEVAHEVAEIIYTNPLPHVLILTAIVVGVATTAVGLALAVRIREAYGTIEEDELDAADDIAEFSALGTPSGVSETSAEKFV